MKKAPNTRLCSKCQRSAAPGRKQCRYHLEYFRKYREKRRAAGICIDCGAASPDFQLCDACASRAAEQMKERYYERRKRGRCTACGAAAKGYSLCDACTERKAERRKSLSSG
ncbi:MAG: hypothetical protein OZ921_20185 [Sorangiineae bacterium]|nr:hypothetical protein [Polyangiaceae bacterium]MEB2324845.1 hypothetical protein [Sorangiineae bacterium]